MLSVSTFSVVCLSVHLSVRLSMHSCVVAECACVACAVTQRADKEQAEEDVMGTRMRTHNGVIGIIVYSTG